LELKPVTAVPIQEQGDSMDPATSGPSDASTSAASELRQLDTRRRAVLGHTTLMALSGALLVFAAGNLPGAPADLQFLFLAATGLFSLASVHAVEEVVTILQAECPRCAGRFFGRGPESLPSPLHRRCGQCGVALSDGAERS